MRKVSHIILFFLAIMLGGGCYGQTVEYYLKASLMEKFARFTEWPSESLNSNFVIGVLGKSPFHGELEKLAETISIKGRPVKIEYYRDYNEAIYCQMIFICESENKSVELLIKDLGSKNILLISDSSGLCERGVHFNFYVKDNGTIHFEVNPKAFAKSGLKTDMLLLSLGKIIN